MSQVFACDIPPTVRPGDMFEVRIPGDHRIQVRCPANMKAGDSFQIRPFAVTVPAGAQPNQQFSAVVNGVNTTIRCPRKVKPGDTITVFAPIFPSRQSEVCKTWDTTKWESYLKKMQETTPGVHENLKNKSGMIDPSEIPSDFVCSITQEIMSDPVLTVDGHTYERKEIENWLKSHDTSPKTNEELPSKILIPNRALRSRIVDFLENYTPKPKPPPAAAATLDDLDFNRAFSNDLNLTGDLEADSTGSDNGDDFGVLDVCQIFIVPQGGQETAYNTQTDQGLSSLRLVGFELKQGTQYRFGVRFRVIGGKVKNLRCIVRCKRSDGKGSVEVSEKNMGTLAYSEDMQEWSCVDMAPRGQQAVGRYESVLQFVDGSDIMFFQCVQSHTITP